MDCEQPRVDTWQLKLASRGLCIRVKQSFGGVYTLLHYLRTAEQVQFQGLDCWTYQTGVPRAQKSCVFEQTFYFTVGQKKILQLRHPSCTFTVLNTDIFSSYWQSVSVKQDIFQFKSNECRKLENEGNGVFREFRITQMIETRNSASFCNMADRFIFATGGCLYDMTPAEVERYDIARDEWEELPELNVERKNHGSCALGATVYVVCGLDTDSDETPDSVEKLDTTNMQAGWQVIQLSIPSLLTMRTDPVVCVLNSSEILIIGGLDEGEYLDDALAFDTRTDTIRQIGQDPSFEFMKLQESSIQVGDGAVVTSVYTADGNENVILFRNGKVRVLHSY